MADVLNQFFVDTATWSLPLWEWQVGLESDETMTTEARRAAVLSKLRYAGNTTAEMIRELAVTVTGYEARVVVNAGEYSFTLEFVGDTPGMANIDVDEVRDMVERIKPAHLRFLISGVTWETLESVNMTWAMLEAQVDSWADLETKVFVHQR